MYDIPEIRHATDAFWQGMARHLRKQGIKQVPRRLIHDQHLSQLWMDDELLISQCCGYDVMRRYKNRLQVLATPWFDAPGCSRGDYASTIVVPEHSSNQDVIDMLGTVVVINGPESHSGMNALFSLVAPYARGGKFFSEVKISGSHVESLVALKNGEAEVAAVDCLTYELLRRYRPTAIEGTRTLGLTYAAPAPPYVTRASVCDDNLARMRTALFATFVDPSLTAARQAMLLAGIELTTVNPYHRIDTEFEHALVAV